MTRRPPKTIGTAIEMANLDDHLAECCLGLPSYMQIRKFGVSSNRRKKPRRRTVRLQQLGCEHRKPLEQRLINAYAAVSLSHHPVSTSLTMDQQNWECGQTRLFYRGQSLKAFEFVKRQKSRKYLHTPTATSVTDYHNALGTFTLW
jgi:hypothetical protein